MSHTILLGEGGGQVNQLYFLTNYFYMTDLFNSISYKGNAQEEIYNEADY